MKKEKLSWSYKSGLLGNIYVYEDFHEGHETVTALVGKEEVKFHFKQSSRSDVEEFFERVALNPTGSQVQMDLMIYDLLAKAVFGV